MPAQPRTARRHQAGQRPQTSAPRIRAGCLWLPVALLLLGVLSFAGKFALEAAGSVGSAVATNLPGAGGGDAWNGTERLNILLLGLDRRADESEELSRSDTLMLLSFDPHTKSASLLSLPRDLLVSIPVTDKRSVEDRINAAFVYGQTTKYPGGGVALAKKTVAQTLGIKVQNAAWIDLAGFVRAVDFLGGLTIDVETPLKDNEFPTWDYGTQRIYFAPGLQHMNGELALMYARSRHQDSDVARANRQQKLLLAAREKALQLDLIPRLPKLIGEFKDTIKSDLSPTDIIGLARYAKDIDAKNILVRTVPNTPAVTSAGAEVLVIDRKKLPAVLAEVFGVTQAVPEVASVEVLNGTTTAGLASRTANLLTERGVKVTRFDNDDTTTRADTVILVAGGKRKTAEQIAGILQLPNDRIKDGPAAGSADVRVLLGRDAKVP